MVRVKRGKIAHKRRKHLLKYTKGFRWGRKSKYKLAKDAIKHAWVHAYRGRKMKKRDFRQLWQLQINAACRQQGLSYGRFIHALKTKKIELDRKILARLVQEKPDVFEKIVQALKK